MKTECQKLEINRLAVGVLTCDRPEFLEALLYDVHYTDKPDGWLLDVTLCDNSVLRANQEFCNSLLSIGLFDVLIRTAVGNAGIADGWNLAFGAMMQPLGYHCRPEPTAIALIQDDVKLEPSWFMDCWDVLCAWPDLDVVSGYNSPKHRTVDKRAFGRLNLYVKDALPGVHLVAKADFWQKIFPLQVIAHHEAEDWYITKYADYAPHKHGHICGVVPGLVKHCGKESKWNSAPHPEYVDQIAEILED